MKSVSLLLIPLLAFSSDNLENYLIKIPFLSQKKYQISPLTSYSNNNYLLENGEEKWVIRIPGESMNFLVDRASEYKNSLLAKKAGVNPLEVVYFEANNGLQVTRYLDGVILPTQETLQNKVGLRQVASLLKKLHECGTSFVNRFDPFERLRKIAARYKEKSGEISSSFSEAIDKMAECEVLISCSPFFEIKPCHNDPVPSNFVVIGDAFQLIDWEYAGNYDPAWDLVYFSSILSLLKEEEELLVAFYGVPRPDVSLAKMSIFKPLIHLTISIWMAWQALENSSKATKEQFKVISVDQFQKYKQSISSVEFKQSLRMLENNEN